MAQILDAQLSTLDIPVFTFPWDEAISPHVEKSEARVLDWADRYDLLRNDGYRERVARSRYAWLAARCYPNAGQELLQAIAEYFVWFFLADDLFVDRIETITPHTLSRLTAMVDVLDYGRSGPQPVYGELAWLDVCRRLRRLLGPEPFERFAQGMRFWATAAGLQILNHLQSTSIGIPQYEAIRRHVSCMNPCIALCDAANGGSVEPDEFYRSDVQTLCRHANNIVCWSNDIQSLVVEARQPGQFRNMVIIYAAQGHTLQEGVDYTAARVNAEISMFMQLQRHHTARKCSTARAHRRA